MKEGGSPLTPSLPFSLRNHQSDGAVALYSSLQVHAPGEAPGLEENLLTGNHGLVIAGRNQVDRYYLSSDGDEQATRSDVLAIAGIGSILAPIVQVLFRDSPISDVLSKTLR